jgi:hypothetical protein
MSVVVIVVFLVSTKDLHQKAFIVDERKIFHIMLHDASK